MYVCVIWYVVYVRIDICVYIYMSTEKEEEKRDREREHGTVPYLNHVSSTSSSCRSTSLPPPFFPPLKLLLLLPPSPPPSQPPYPYLACANTYASSSSWATMYSSSDNPSTYQTGILWPHQSCRDMHQGRMLVSLGYVCTWVVKGCGGVSVNIYTLHITLPYFATQLKKHVVVAYHVCQVFSNLAGMMFSYNWGGGGGREGGRGGGGEIYTLVTCQATTSFTHALHTQFIAICILSLYICVCVCIYRSMYILIPVRM